MPSTHQIIKDLYPICRSITGDGLRATLEYVQKYIGIEITEVLSGTAVFDWTVPDEWNIRDGFICNDKGDRIVDFRESNLHVVNYSEPIRGSFSLDELRPHLHTIPDQPDAIPYVTSYYKQTWGFCLSHNLLKSLEDGQYTVEIDSSLEPGSLSYGELLVPGKTDQEILVSCHCCHPSLANDNLSGIAVAMHLARHLSNQENRFSYRFIFAPGTIGAIAWLAENEDVLPQIAGGLTLANLGDSGHFNYKRSRQHDSLIDNVVSLALNDSGHRYGIRNFSPYGYDERQYCSPGIDLPVGSFTRSIHGTFSEYHTSRDNLDFVNQESLKESFALLQRVVDILEHNSVFENLNPKCEPQLGKRGLYSTTGGFAATPDYSIALLWVLNYSDGTQSLMDISVRSGIAFDTIVQAANRLRDARLIEEKTDWLAGENEV
ncbi:MAG: DUF4910 domain-containing protein [Rhodothermales bacterium]|nr:DUF4910 domain-containing protein [Rhodothermales bacterium]